MDWSSTLQMGLLLIAALLAYFQLRNYNEIERFRNTQSLVEAWYADCAALFDSFKIAETRDYERRRSEIAGRIAADDASVAERSRRLFAFMANAQYLMQRRLVDEESFLFSLASRAFAVCYVLQPAIAGLPNARRRYDFTWLSRRAYRYMIDHVLEEELHLPGFVP